MSSPIQYSTLHTSMIIPTLLSSLTTQCTAKYAQYDIIIKSNSDTIKLNRNLGPMMIPVMDIFISNLGKDMLGVKDDKTITPNISLPRLLKTFRIYSI